MDSRREVSPSSCQYRDKDLIHLRNVPQHECKFTVEVTRESIELVGAVEVDNSNFALDVELERGAGGGGHCDVVLRVCGGRVVRYVCVMGKLLSCWIDGNFVGEVWGS